MSFYSDASLVMIPSGYKTSKVYSAVPTDGTGDLTFTRSNDTATRVGPDGLIEKVRTNLILQSETFDNAYWTKAGGSSVTANSVANPINGAVTADTLTVGTTTYSGLYGAGTGSGIFTQSIYAKKNTIDFLYFFNPAGTSIAAWFNLANGTLGQVTAGFSANIESVGNGWYRCSIRNTASESNNYLQIGLSSTDGSNTPAAAGSAYIFGAQSEFSDFGPTDYIATTSAAVSVGPVANVPRLDYLNSSCPRLLLEPQRTNSATYSEQINNAAWGKLNVTVSANQAVAPDGTTSADLVYPTTTGADRLIEQLPVAVIGQTWTSSLFVKASGFTWVLMYSPNLVSCWFNASTGVFGTVGAGATASVLGQVNGYWRISLTGTVASSNAYLYAGPADANGTTTATANGTNGLLFWGCQVEQGAYATSYIPTLGAAVTRGADSASKTSATALIGQTEGTLFAEVEWTVKPESGSPIISLVALNNTTNLQNCIVLGVERQSAGTNRFYSFVQVSNSTTAALIGSNITNGRYKAAFAYKENDFVLYVNGVQIATDTSGVVPTNSQVIVGGRFVGDSFQVSDPISQAIVFPTRLSNADLAALTA